MAEVAATDPTAAGASWSFSKMLADPNFQLLLANMGKAADPEGAGGVIGGAASNLISSKAAQGALEKRDAARQEQMKRLIDLHAGITPPDKPGLNSIKMTPAGAVALELNLGDPETGVASRSAIAPTSTTTAPARTQLLTGEQPKAPVIPTAPQVSTTPVQAPIRTANARDVADIFPFY